MTIAEERQQEIIGKATEAALADLQTKMEACSSEEEMLALIGSKPGEFDLEQEDLFAIRMAFKQLGAMFSSGALLILDKDQIDALGARAKAPNLIVVERTAERVLTDIFERGNSEFVGKYFAQPGRVENIELDRHSIEARHYEDGSMVIQSQSHSKANIAIRIDMLSRVSKLSEALSETETAELRKAMDGAIAAFANNPDITARAKALIPDLMEAELLTIFRGITAASGAPVSLPLADGSALIRMMDKHAKDGAWHEGVSVSVDGAPCATPAALHHAMGLHPATTLDDALARMRKAKSTQAPDATPNAAPVKRPRR